MIKNVEGIDAIRQPQVRGVEWHEHPARDGYSTFNKTVATYGRVVGHLGEVASQVTDLAYSGYDIG